MPVLPIRSGHRLTCSDITVYYRQSVVKKDRMLSETLNKFKYPENLVKKYDRWLLLLRSKQVTLGSMILICSEEARSFSAISSEAFAELPTVIRDIETNLKGSFDYEKINYLMLMMVDPEVHMHVIPRYSCDVEFGGKKFADSGWPGVPDLSVGNDIDDETFRSLVGYLKDKFL